jgi:hypothetical protein
MSKKVASLLFAAVAAAAVPVVACSSAPNEDAQSQSSALWHPPPPPLCQNGPQTFVMWSELDGTIANSLSYIWYKLSNTWTSPGGVPFEAYAGVNWSTQTVDYIAWVPHDNASSFAQGNKVCEMWLPHGNNLPPGANTDPNGAPKCEPLILPPDTGCLVSQTLFNDFPAAWLCSQPTQKPWYAHSCPNP